MLYRLKVAKVHLTQLKLVLRCFYVDFLVFVLSTKLFFRRKSKENSEANLRATLHSIERGFSLAQTRRPFGQKLLEGLEYWRGCLDEEEKNNIVEMYQIGRKELKDWNNGFGEKPRGDLFGVVAYNSKTISEGGRRRSVRYYSEHKVPENELFEIIERAANNAPSVCNRQTCRVYLVADEDSVSKVLEIQNGNSGMEGAFQLLVITSDASCFIDATERNQWAIDGGFFAQSLLMEAHDRGLGTCPLNCSLEPKSEKKVKEIIGASFSERLICMISIGNIHLDNVSAFSKKKEIDEFVVTVK